MARRLTLCDVFQNTSMLKNYIKIAIRNLKRNKAFSILNILGLALGLTSSLFIFLWIRHEKNIDAWHADSSRIYKIYGRQYHDGRIDAGYYTPGLLPAEIKRVFPEIELSTGYATDDFSTFQVGDKILKQQGSFASEDFFKIFSYKLLSGSAQTALNHPTSIAISETMAINFFGSIEAAMGKTIRYLNTDNLIVTGIFEDLKDNVSEKFDYLINWDIYLKYNQWAKDWGNIGPQTIIKLKEEAVAGQLSKKIVRFLDKYSGQDEKFYIELGLQHYSETYLNAKFENGIIVGGRIEYVRLFGIISIFILVIACINFMNLTTARSVKRAKEIGIRKVSGAYRLSLVKQFIGEAIFLSCISVLCALLAVMLLLPYFNTLTGKEIELPVSEFSFWNTAILLALITGIVSGSYPAIFLSGLKPVRILKGSLNFTTSSVLLRKGLVVFQFTLSIVLIIGTIVISRQVSYIQNANLGYDRENLVYIPLEGELAGKYHIFKQEAQKIDGVNGISRTSISPTNIQNSTGGVVWNQKDPNSMPQFSSISVGYDYISTMKLQLLEGRDYSPSFSTDSNAYIINESALKIIGYKNPIGKRLALWGREGTIIGVLNDFHFNSLHQPIKPLILRLKEKETYGNALVRIGAGHSQQALNRLKLLCQQLNPAFPFTYQFSDEEYAKLYSSEQVVRKLSNLFALLAIVIACLGLLGLAMFTAEQRTKEFGIRKVLGASVGSLFGLLSREFLLLVLLAFLIAAPLGWLAASNWLKDFEFHTAINWWIFVVAGLSVTAITLLTISFQAIKAALANPVKSLRTE